ncbi:hypothetical protein ALC53_10923 [Atta colombica]|uniref:Uncharacterized protein n=1 Tax=Atta colombica TaxID=520822 RepID=A0A151HZL3_9HYME|nr:hypothetical protein ALC53_10923 [Atta colombica]
MVLNKIGRTVGPDEESVAKQGTYEERSLWGFDSAVDHYTSGYNGAGVSAPGLESGSQRSLFGPYLHSGIHGLGNTAPLTAVGWSKGNELACPPGR